MKSPRTFRGGGIPYLLAAVLGAAGPGVLAAGTVELLVVERQGVPRVDEPVTFAVPLPKGELRGAGQARLMRGGVEVPAQFRATCLWRPDDSIQWLLVDFMTDIDANASHAYTLEYGDGIAARGQPAATVRIEEDDDGYRVTTGAARFQISKKIFDLFGEMGLADGTVVVAPPEAGMKSVNLVFEGSEWSLLAEALAFDLYRRAGNPAPLTEFVRLWVDGRMVGYHLAVERINKSFLRRNKVDEDGNLYKIQRMGRDIVGQHEKRTHTHTGHEDLLAINHMLEKATADDLWKVIQENFNVDEVATYFAVNMVLSHWDGFFNNHFPYHDTKNDTWEMYPWDHDKTGGYTYAHDCS